MNKSLRKNKDFYFEGNYIKQMTVNLVFISTSSGQGN